MDKNNEKGQDEKDTAEEGALPLEEGSEEVGADAEEESTDEESVESTDEEESSGTEEDYEARLDEERKRLGGKIDKEREKRIAAERKQGITREEAEKIADEKLGGFRKEMSRERALAIAERMAKGPAERDLIMFHYDNSIIPSANIEEDVEKAHAIANRKKTKATISELERSVAHKKTTSKGGSDGGQPIEQKPKQKYSQEVLDGAKFAGVSPEEFVKGSKVNH